MIWFPVCALGVVALVWSYWLGRRHEHAEMDGVLDVYRGRWNDLARAHEGVSASVLQQGRQGGSK